MTHVKVEIIQSAVSTHVATFPAKIRINGVEFVSDRPNGSGEAETINRDIEILAMVTR
jgi:hypothetical protein